MFRTLSKSLLTFAIVAVVACDGREQGPRTSDAATPKAAGMVSIQSLVPDIQLEIRYAGENNFVGTPVRGYEAEMCYLLKPATEALARVEQALRAQAPSPVAPLASSPASGSGDAQDASSESRESLRLKIFDCYRPVRAVKHFVEWAEDLNDQATKARYYPNLDKTQLLGDYIAPVSGHSRGATVDLTLVRCNEKCVELDMGTDFDFFDPLANTDSPNITDEQRANRQLLRRVMEAEGFKNYPMEWWHYTFEAESDLAHDFLVR
jgi:D-alanyl-D-alanine dipeptidase